MQQLQSWTKGYRQIHEIKQNRVFCGMFRSWFFANFLLKNVKIWLLGKRLGRAEKIRFFGTQKSVLLKASSGECCAPRNFVLLVMLGGTCVCLIVYLIKWNRLCKCWNKFRYSCVHQNDLIDLETLKNIWRSSGVFIVHFGKIPHLFLVFHCWIWENVTNCVYQQRSKYR